MVAGKIPFVKRRPPHEASAPILEASHVTVLYNGRPALEDVSFRLASGERVAVVGPTARARARCSR